MYKILLIFTLFLVQIQAQVAPLEKATLLLSWKHQFQFAGYYMAKEKGFYRDADLNITIKEYDSNIDTVKYVASQKYAFGIKHSPLILDRIDRYHNLKFLATIYQSSPLILISKKYSNFQSLKNKKVNLTNDDYNNASILAMLHLNGINKSNIASKKIDFTLESFINNSVDFYTAYSSNEPFTLHKMGIDFYTFDPKEYGYDFYSDILFTSQELIEKKPLLVEHFYRASMKGWIYAFSHIDESVEIILKYYNTQKRSREALRFEAFALKKLAYKGETPLGNINPEKLQEIATTFRLLGLVQSKNSKIDYDDFIYDKAFSHNKHKHIFLKFYRQYQQEIRVFILLFLLLVLFMAYFRYKMKKLLHLKIKELDKSYKLFDEYTIASRTDTLGNITFVTQAFCNATGYTKEELIGKNQNIFRERGALPDSHYKEMWMSIKSGHIWHGEFQNITKDTRHYWANAVISPLYDNANNIIGYESVVHDITIKKVLEEFNQKLEKDVEEKTLQLKKYTNYLNTLFNINPNITYVLKNDKLELVNKAFLNFTQVSSRDEFLLHQNCLCKLFHTDSHQETLEKNGHLCTIDAKITMFKNGIKHHFVMTRKEFELDKNKLILVSLEDITEIQNLAITDKLTNIYNRVKIDEEIALNYSYYELYQDIFSLIILDIDLFKKVNDTHGHQIGDEILKDFSQIIQASIRDTDIFGRWGGEEFLIICPNTDKAGAFTLANIIKINIENHSFTRNLSITASAGVCDVKDSKNIDTMINSADNALYKAKGNGRNRVEKA